MKVLVLEDNDAIRLTLAMVLECLGYAPFLAQTQEEAIRVLEQETPAAFILDLTLEEASGEDVYRAIERRFGSVPPTLVLSAVHDGEDRVRKLPGVQFLSKPYRVEDLSDRLGALLGASAPALA